jgi:ABC-2 type transport system ATP-binding protein
VAKVGDRDRVVVGVAGDREALALAAGAVDGVDSARAVEGGVEILCRNGRALLPRLVEIAVGSGAQITSIEVVEPDLETVFLHLTGKALRE